MRSDAQLIRAFVAKRDEDAFAQLVDRHWAIAQRLAYRCLGNAPAAEDVAQEAFVRLARLSGSSWELKGPFGAYFRTLVLNAAFDAAKLRGRRRRHEGQVRSAAPSSDSSPEEGGLEAEEVRRELLRLPDDLRLPLVLRYYDGCSHREVADQLGCPAGTASSWIRRGLERLREALEPARTGALTSAAIAAALAIAPAPAAAAPAPAASALLAFSTTPRPSPTPLILSGLALLVLLLAAWGFSSLGASPSAQSAAGDTPPSSPTLESRAPSLEFNASDSEGEPEGEGRTPPVTRRSPGTGPPSRPSRSPPSRRSRAPSPSEGTTATGAFSRSENCRR